jgi:predicted DNA-binding antitoxin AbrB/MazE fold protein
MTITVAAIYEGDGVLKLERPVELREKTRVHVIIEAEGDVALSDETDDPTGWKAIDSLRGIVKDAPRDMAENHDKYLYGGFEG